MKMASCTFSPPDISLAFEGHVCGGTASGYDSDELPGDVIEFYPEKKCQGKKETFRFLCPSAGQFRCRTTGLVFGMESRGELTYETAHWDLGLISPTGQEPAGPLFDIRCPQGALAELQLPHCELDDRRADFLSVAHMSCGNVEVLRPLEVTATHVTVSVPDLSLWGLVKRLSKPRVLGQVLLFLRPGDGVMMPKVNVFVLPGNVPLCQVTEQQDSCCVYLRTSSGCELSPMTKYKVSSGSREVVRIQPEGQSFYCVYGPNFHPTFEVFLDHGARSLDLQLLKCRARDREEQVWTRFVELPADSPATATPTRSNEFATAQRISPVSRQLWAEALNAVIEELETDEYKKLKNLLHQSGIPRGALGGTERPDMAHRIISHFGVERSVEVVEDAVGRIPRNDPKMRDILKPFLEQLG
ncbi:NLRP1 protein, partial [Atractosteus spatula]|nr:NLRP1 protein [Atractosteus spatula]